MSRTVLASMTYEEPQENFSDICDEILQAALVRTIASSVTEYQVYRVSGSNPSSSRPKARNRARKISYTAGTAPISPSFVKQT